MQTLFTQSKRADGEARAHAPLSPNRSSQPRRRIPHEYRLAGTFLALPLLLFGLFHIVPDLYNFYYAFTDWSSFKDRINFVGFASFRFLLFEAGGPLAQAIKVTLIFAVVMTVIQQLVGLVLAVALEQNTRLNVILRGAFFLPVLMSSLAAGYIFRGILDPAGPLNAGLSLLFGHSIAYPWLGSVSITLLAVAAIQAWKGFPISMMVYIAALNTVPHSQIEAARIEGAGFWQTLWRIKLPLIGPAFTFNIVSTLIAGLGSADIILATTSGGPGDATQVLGIYTFLKFGQGYFGQATAGSLVLFIFVSLAALPMIVYLRRREVTL